METGTGKTLIASLLIEHFLDKRQQREAHHLSPPAACAKAQPDPITVSVFLAPTVALVRQQTAALQEQLPLAEVRSYAGRGGEFEAFDAGRWSEELQAADVLVMTPAILVRMCVTSSTVS